MSNGGFVVLPNAVLRGLDGRPSWWRDVYEIVAGWADHEGGVHTYVAAIRRALDDRYSTKTRQGTLPCEKSIRRVLGFFREAGWLGCDVRANQAHRSFVGHLTQTLTTMLASKKRECLSAVSKWKSRRSIGKKAPAPRPVSKSSGQGFQTGIPFFNNEPVDKSGVRPPTAAERAALDALRGMYAGKAGTRAHG